MSPNGDKRIMGAAAIISREVSRESSQSSVPTQFHQGVTPASDYPNQPPVGLKLRSFLNFRKNCL